MTTALLLAVRAAVHAAASKPVVHVHDDFVVFNGTGRLATAKLLARSLGQRLWRGLARR